MKRSTKSMQIKRQLNKELLSVRHPSSKKNNATIVTSIENIASANFANIPPSNLQDEFSTSSLSVEECNIIDSAMSDFKILNDSINNRGDVESHHSHIMQADSFKMKCLHTNSFNCFDCDQLYQEHNKNEVGNTLSSVSIVHVGSSSLHDTFSNVSNESSRNNIVNDLRFWALKFHVNHVQLNALLHILKAHHQELPLDARTLLQTVINSGTDFGNAQKSSEFVYLGIENSLILQLQSGLGDILQNFNPKIIQLVCNIDGIPIARSSSAQFWPILGMSYMDCYKTYPFVIALYYGVSKPPDLQCFLRQFIKEINHLIQNDLLYNGCRYQVYLKALVCDAPARAFLKCIKGHAGYYGCERCHQKGTYIEHRLVYSNLKTEVNIGIRTDENFRMKIFGEHHVDESPLLKVLNFDMVYGFILDYMHLACLGVSRRMLNIWCKGNSSNRLSPRFKALISKNSVELAKYIPLEFGRKPRSLSELDRWKATEFRLFSLYTGIVLLKNKLADKLYKHFLLFSVVMRIVAEGNYGHELGNIANKLIKLFVEKYEQIYGVEAMVYNVHSLQHMVNDMIHQGLKLDDISCFPFESYLGCIKKLLRQPYRPLQQVVRRLAEQKNQLLRFTHKCLYQEVTCVDGHDIFVLLNNKAVIKVLSINEHSLEGYMYGTVENLFDFPIASEKINVFKVTDLGSYKFSIDSHNVLCRCIVLPCENYFVSMPIIGTFKNKCQGPIV